MGYVLLIGAGGFFGAITRYLVDGRVVNLAGAAAPWGTFAINVSGSFFIGLLFALMTERVVITPELRGPLMIGFMARAGVCGAVLIGATPTAGQEGDPEIGRRLYTDKQCARCHVGGGPAAALEITRVTKDEEWLLAHMADPVAIAPGVRGPEDAAPPQLVPDLARPQARVLLPLTEDLAIARTVGGSDAHGIDRRTRCQVGAFRVPIPGVSAVGKEHDPGYRPATIPFGDQPQRRRKIALSSLSGQFLWRGRNDGVADGVQVLGRMLDRAYVERNVTRQPQPREDIDPVGEVMISGLRAIAALREATLSPQVKALSTDDQNLKVRQAALETLKTLG